MVLNKVLTSLAVILFTATTTLAESVVLISPRPSAEGTPIAVVWI